MDKLDQIIGPTFTPAMTFAGYVVMLGGVAGIFFDLLWGIFFGLFGAFIALSKNGLRIDPTEKVYQSYTKTFGFKLGKWQSLGSYADLSILKSKVTTQAYSHAMQAAETSANLYFDVYLLNPNHRKKLLVARCKSLSSATELAGEYSLKLKMPLVQFNPKRLRKSRHKS